jgi:NADH:ubiquinone oxidoreductase subunit H
MSWFLISVGIFCVPCTSLSSIRILEDMLLIIIVTKGLILGGYHKTRFRQSLAMRSMNFYRRLVIVVVMMIIIINVNVIRIRGERIMATT